MLNWNFISCKRNHVKLKVTGIPFTELNRAVCRTNLTSPLEIRHGRRALKKEQDENHLQQLKEAWSMLQIELQTSNRNLEDYLSVHGSNLTQRNPFHSVKLSTVPSFSQGQAGYEGGRFGQQFFEDQVKTFLGRLKHAMQIVLSISFPIAVAEDVERLQTIY